MIIFYHNDIIIIIIIRYVRFRRRLRTADSHTDGAGSVAVMTSHPVRLFHVTEKRRKYVASGDDGRHRARTGTRSRSSPTALPGRGSWLPSTAAWPRTSRVTSLSAHRKSRDLWAGARPLYWSSRSCRRWACQLFADRSHHGWVARSTVSYCATMSAGNCVHNRCIQQSTN